MADEQVKITITFKGDVPGLASHRLSLGVFAQPLSHLVTAYRRIATGMLTEALGDSEYGGKGGRYRKEVETLDLEVSKIVDGCTSFEVFCTVQPPPTGQQFLFENGFRERAADILLDSIEAESRGEFRNYAVRRYLTALPKGLSGQEYALRSGAHSRSVRVGSMNLPEAPRSSVIYLERVEAQVIGVGFAPGPIEVRVRTASGNNVLTLKATEEQVSQALEMRDTPAVAMVLRGEDRLLWIKPAPFSDRPSRDEVIRHVMTRWSGVLERLAK